MEMQFFRNTFSTLSCDQKSLANPPHAFTFFFCAYFLICIIYRITFYVRSTMPDYTILHLAPGWFIFSNIALGFTNDLLTGVGFFLIFLFIKKISSLTMPDNKATPRFIVILTFTLLSVLLFMMNMLNVAQYTLGLDIMLQIDLSLIISSLQQGFTPDNYHYFINSIDKIILVSPIVILLFFIFTSTTVHKKILFYFVLPFMLLGIAMGVIISSAHSINYSFINKSILKANPTGYLAYDALHHLIHNQYSHSNEKPSQRQMQSIGLIDPIFVNPSLKKAPALATAKTIPHWNIVLLILESVGSNYVFDTGYHNATPMPFLKNLAQKGLWLNNNYAAGNNSPLGIFSILSGIYPNPLGAYFEIRHDLRIPNLAGLLGHDYDAFLVTPSSVHAYFPRGFVENSGFKEISDINSMPIKNKRAFLHQYLDENSSFDFFLSRMNDRKKPFLGVYYSGAAHFPYFEYGKDYHVMSTLQNPLSRYLNNLNLLDHKIEALYTFLKEKNLLDNTIIIITGDHGEEFGQHPGQGNWMHGLALHQEQIKTPVLIFQPKLFSPQIINTLTSNVDIVPTLLDAIGIPYNPDAIQGEPLLQQKLQRKYVFIVGAEDEIASIDPYNIKMQINFSQGICHTYNLNNDPGELHPKTCNPDAQQKAILQFHYLQKNILPKFNQQLVEANRQKILAIQKDLLDLMATIHQ